MNAQQNTNSGPVEPVKAGLACVAFATLSFGVGVAQFYIEEALGWNDRPQQGMNIKSHESRLVDPATPNTNSWVPK